MFNLAKMSTAEVKQVFVGQTVRIQLSDDTLIRGEVLDVLSGLFPWKPSDIILKQTAPTRASARKIPVARVKLMNTVNGELDTPANINIGELPVMTVQELRNHLLGNLIAVRTRGGDVYKGRVININESSDPQSPKYIKLDRMNPTATGVPVTGIIDIVWIHGERENEINGLPKVRPTDSLPQKADSELYTQVDQGFNRLKSAKPHPELLRSFAIHIGGPALNFEETITVTPANNELTYTLITPDREEHYRIVDHTLALKTMLRLSEVDFSLVPINAMAWNLDQQPEKNVLPVMITLTTDNGTVEFLPTAYFRLGLPLEWAKVVRSLRKDFKHNRRGVVFDQSVFTAGHLHGELIVLGVQFTDFGKKYNYLADSDIYKVGDYVDVPVGPDNEPKSVLVVDILYPQSESQLPFPISKTKHVLGKSQRIY